MSFSFNPAAPRTLAVGVSDDPYKKYWWLILLGVAATGAWMCAPMMETSVGSTHVNPNPPAADAAGDMGLAAAASGSAGHAYDLSMGDTGKKKDAKDSLDASGSMLMPELQDATTAGAAAAGAPIAATASGGASGSLASLLKNIGRKNDAAGWGGEKAQRGFDAPHLNGGSMSGLGSVSGGKGGSSSVGAFGTRNAQVQASAGHGPLVDDGADAAAAAGRASMGALNKMAAQANKAALQQSNDAAASQMNRLFDGQKGANQIATGGSGGGAAGAYAALDQSPVNLKINPDGEDTKKITAPPAAPVPPSSSSMSGTQMAEMLGGMVMSAAIGGLVPGIAGQMLAMTGMMAMQNMMQQQQAQQQAAAAAKAQAAGGGH